MNFETLSSSMLFNVVGLYLSFLTWSLFQEKINTRPYKLKEKKDPVVFNSSLIINLCQTFFSFLIGFIYSKVVLKKNPLKSILINKDEKLRYFLLQFISISISSTTSSALSYSSFKDVNYLVYLLIKSCKLIPAILVHSIFYKTKFPTYKYVAALLVTTGIIFFSLFHNKINKSKKIHQKKKIIAILKLILSMFLDGFTNSTQDHVFKKSKDLLITISGSDMMCILNFLSFIIFFVFAIFFSYKKTFNYTLNFMLSSSNFCFDLILFAFFGGIGQIFVFLILEKFDSLVLITVTITRKMFSMLLSVMFFGHSLSNFQCLGVVLVFAGIIYESLIKHLLMNGKLLDLKNFFSFNTFTIK